MLTAIRQWVIKTMTKGQTGVVTTMPKQQIIEMNVQITAERIMRNGINPEDLKTVGQVENVINQIDQPKVIQADSAKGKGITEQFLGKKKADVLDMEGNKIPDGAKIMGGKQVESDAVIKARLDADNKKGIAGIQKKIMEEDREIENLYGSAGFGNDQKIDAEFLAEYLAENAGKVYDDLPTKQRLDFYGRAYNALTRYKKNVGRSVIDEPQKGPGTPEFDGVNKDPEDFATGGRVGLKGGAFLNFIKNMTMNKKSPLQFGKDYLKNVKEKTLRANETGKFMDLPLAEVGIPATSGAFINNQIRKKLENMNEDQKEENLKMFIMELENDEFYDKYPDIKDEMIADYTEKLFGEKKADGGRIGYFMGSAFPKGAATLREMLQLFGKRSDSVKNPSDILKIVNPKQFNKTLEDPRIYRKFDVEKGIGAPDMIKNIQKKMTSDRQSTVKEMLDAAKNIKKSDDATLKYKNEMIEEMMNKGASREMAEEMAETISKMAEGAAGKSNTPKLTDEGILQLENILKNMETGGKKPRDLNADGGRIGYKVGSVDKMRRLILKAFGAGTAGIAAAKSGIFSGVGKGATKQVAKEVAQQTTSSMPPPYFFKLAEKIKMMGDDVTATTERTIAKKLKSKDGKSEYLLEEDLATGDTIIKKINKEGDEMITDVEIMELKKGEVVMGKNGKPVKVPDEYEEVTESNSRIYKDEFNDPDYTDGIKVDEIIKEVDDKVPSIKYASGGLAYMLGE